MSRLMFALVDAVFYGRMTSALRTALNPATPRFEASAAQGAFNTSTASWSWWRSLWGVL